MSHKTKEMRQQEAMERKRRFLPAIEAGVAEAIAYARQHPEDNRAEERLRSKASALQAAYVDAGYSRDAAAGMANAAAAGRPGSWISGPITGERSSEAATIEDLVDRVRSMTPAASLAHVMPHPFRPAIRITLTFESQSEKHLVADMCILEIDRVIDALCKCGIPAARLPGA